jgi:hypothetical protein
VPARLGLGAPAGGNVASDCPPEARCTALAIASVNSVSSGVAAIKRGNDTKDVLGRSVFVGPICCDVANELCVSFRAGEDAGAVTDIRERCSAAGALWDNESGAVTASAVDFESETVAVESKG